MCSEASSRRVVWHDVDQPVSSASSVQICAAQALLKGKSLPCLRRLAHNRRLSQPRANRFDFMFAVGRMYFRVGCRSCGAFGVFGAKMPRIYKFGVYNSVALNWLPPIQYIVNIWVRRGIGANGQFVWDPDDLDSSFANRVRHA